LKRVVSLIYAAHTPVKFIRGSDNTANPTKHYAQLQARGVGEYACD
jgi:hypothetical protein